MLRASAERDHKAIQNIERHTKEQRENMSRLVEGALESVHLLTAKQEAETAERLKAYHKQISSLQPDYAKLGQKTAEDMLSKWEKTLAQGGAAGSSTAGSTHADAPATASAGPDKGSGASGKGQSPGG